MSLLKSVANITLVNIQIRWLTTYEFVRFNSALCNGELRLYFETLTTYTMFVLHGHPMNLNWAMLRNLKFSYLQLEWWELELLTDKTFHGLSHNKVHTLSIRNTYGMIPSATNSIGLKNKLIRLIDLFPGLQKLELLNVSDFDDCVVVQIPHILSTLTHFSFSNDCKLRRIYDEIEAAAMDLSRMFNAISKSVRNLRIVTLNINWSEKIHFVKLLNGIITNNPLEELSVRCLEPNKYKVGVWGLHIAKQCANLRLLKLIGFNVPMMTLTSIIQNCKQLRYLIAEQKLYNTSDKGRRVIFSVVEQHLCLDIRHNNLDNIVTAGCLIISSIPSLSSITFRDVIRNDIDMYVRCIAMHQTGLREFHMYNCFGLQSITANVMLANCTSLSHFTDICLEHSSNLIYGEGYDISVFKRHLPMLRHIVVKNVVQINSSVLELLDLLEQNQQLLYVCVKMYLGEVVDESQINKLELCVKNGRVLLEYFNM